MTTPIFNILTAFDVSDPGALEIEGVCRVVRLTEGGEFRDAAGPVRPEALADAETILFIAGEPSRTAAETIARLERATRPIARRIDVEGARGEARTAAVLRAVAELLFGRYRTLCGLLNESKAQTIALRNSLDRNARAFQALESYHAGADFQQGRLLYASGEWEAGRAPSERLALNAATGPLRQRLPVESGGLNLIRIFVGFAAEERRAEDGSHDSEILVRLQDDDLGASVCEWRIADDGSRGWRALGLREGYVEPYRALSLRIEAAPAARVEIGLSAPLASDRYAASTETGGPLDRALAMEIRAGLPGVGVAYAASVARDARPAGVSRGWLKVPLSEIAGGGVAAISDTSWARGFQPVTADGALRTIACHPPPGGRVTVAQLACLEGVALRSVDARISLNNERANPVDFAIAAGPANVEEIERCLAQHPDDPAESLLRDGAVHFSGWKTLAANQSLKLHLEMEGFCAPDAVMFLTRMRGDVSNDFAWAQFSNPFSVVQAKWERPHMPADDA